MSFSDEGTIDNYGTIVNSGGFFINAGIVNNYGTIDNSGGGGVTIGGVFTNYGTFADSTQIFDVDVGGAGSALVNYGSIDVFGGILVEAGGGAITNENSGVLTVESSGTIGTGGCSHGIIPPSINNYGTIIVLSTIRHGGFGIGNCFSVTLNNYGFINIAGTDGLGINFNGVLNNENGGSITITSNLDDEGILTNYGVINNEGGAPGGLTIDNGGPGTPEGILSNYGIIDNENGAFLGSSGFITNGGIIIFECGATFVNTGTFTGNPVLMNACLSCPQVPNTGGVNLQWADLQDCNLAG